MRTSDRGEDSDVGSPWAFLLALAFLVTVLYTMNKAANTSSGNRRGSDCLIRKDMSSVLGGS